MLLHYFLPSITPVPYLRWEFDIWVVVYLLLCRGLTIFLVGKVARSKNDRVAISIILYIIGFLWYFTTSYLVFFLPPIPLLGLILW